MQRQEVTEPAVHFGHGRGVDNAYSSHKTVAGDSPRLLGHYICRLRKPEVRSLEPDMVRPASVDRRPWQDDRESVGLFEVQVACYNEHRPTPRLLPSANGIEFGPDHRATPQLSHGSVRRRE